MWSTPGTTSASYLFIREEEAGLGVWSTPDTTSASYIYIREEEAGLGVWSTCWKRGVKMRRNIVASNFQVKLERPKGSACKVTLKLIRELRVFISKLVCKLPEEWSVR